MSVVILPGGRRILNDDEDDDDEFLQSFHKARQTKDPSQLTCNSHEDDLVAQKSITMSQAEPASVTQRRLSPLRRLRLTKSVGNYATVPDADTSAPLQHETSSPAQSSKESMPGHETSEKSPLVRQLEDLTVTIPLLPATTQSGHNVTTTEGSPKPVKVDLPHRVQTRSSSLQGSCTPPSRTQTLRDSSVRSGKSPSRESSIPSKASKTSENTHQSDTLISYGRVKSVVKEHLRYYHEGHARLLKSCLRRERMRVGASEKKASRSDGSITSPFDRLQPVNEKLICGTRKLVHTTFQGSNPKTYHIDQPTISAPSIVTAPPPYTSYIPLNKSVLVENERRLPSWPIFAGYEDAGEEYDRDVTKAYSQGTPEFWEHETLRVHKAESLGFCIEAAFKQLGCTFTDALRCLLNRPKTWWSELGDLEKAILKDSKKWTPTWWNTAKLDRAELNRSKSAWRSILSRLPTSDPAQLAMAGLLCAAVADICKVNVWDVATHHKPYVKSLSEEDGARVRRSLLATELCRICFNHNCVCHGEFLDDSDSESGSSASELSQSTRLRKTDLKARTNVKQNVQVDLNRSDALGNVDLFYTQNQENSVRRSAYLGQREGQSLPTGDFNHSFKANHDGDIPDHQMCSDRCFWKVSNRLLPIEKWTPAEEATLLQNLPAYGSNRRGPCLLASALSKPCIEVFAYMLVLSSKLPWEPRQPRGQFGLSSDTTFEQELKDRNVHYPCSHEGPCSASNCPCYQANVECEKTCHCNASCPRRFPGCSCKRQGKICHGNPECKCFMNHRECDVDLCSSCGADEVLDPMNRNEKGLDWLNDRCRNVSIQRAVAKNTYVGNSTVPEAGYGLFMGEPTKRHDYIGPYSGFLLSKTEADRLGVIYHEQTHVYLFVANKDLEVDCLLAGSKIRFINHSGDAKTINCQAFLYLCNGTVNIALYALKDIAVGQELFFNYGYTKQQTLRFVEKGVHDGSITADEAIKAFGNVAVRPDRPTSKGSIDAANTTTEAPGPAAMASLDDWPPPTKSDSEDEDYREGENGGSGKKHGQRSARKRARSSSSGSGSVDRRRKRAKAK